MIRLCSSRDIPSIYAIINDAATAYKGHIPQDCYHEPYMPLNEMEQEMHRVSFYGWEEEGKLLGIMGLEPILDTTLIRHAYVLTAHQRKSIGSHLLAHLIDITKTPMLLVGTWSAAKWAVVFYQKHGFQPLFNKDELLLRYWVIPDRQRETSVVLGFNVKGGR